MSRRYSSVVTAVLVLTLATGSSLAQSGRGRQLRVQQTLRGEGVASVVAEVELSETKRIDTGLSKASQMEIRRNRGLIYNDAAANQQKNDDDYHVTKGDKRAAWILLGMLVLVTVVTIASD